MIVDVVISAYNRDTSWSNKLKAHGYNIITYTKNVDEPMSKTNINVNRGNEASSYLKHIVENYEHLADRTVFLHDQEMSWHHEGSIVDLVVKNIDNAYINLNNYITYSILKNRNFNKLIKDYFNPYLRPYIGDHEQFGDWTYGKKGCAQYIVSRDIIISKPKIMYENLLKWILDANWKKLGYDQGQFMEWTWDLIFLAKLVL